jgi:hypothetical protein
MSNRSLKTNFSGYNDPTAYEAIIHADLIEDEKVRSLFKDIFEVCKRHGVYINGNITIEERNSGKKAKRVLRYRNYYRK